MIKTHVAAPAIDQGAISHLFENLDLIVRNKQTIMRNSEYRNLKIPGLFVGGLYVGMREMSLGDILDLWETTEWHTDSKYYLNIIGSPLSGTNHSWWYNIETKRFGSGEYFNGKVHFIGLASPAIKYLQAHPKEGGPSAMTIFDLVNELQH